MNRQTESTNLVAGFYFYFSWADVGEIFFETIDV